MAWVYSFLFFVCTIFRIKCGKPRLRPGTASMSPQVIRDRLEHLYCERWKYHPGRCEAKLVNPDPREESESETWQ